MVAVLRQRGLIPPVELAIFLVGSMARGWAHATSDIDLVLVSTERFTDDRAMDLNVPLAPGTLQTVTFHHEGRRWEVKYWLDSQVDELFGKVTWAAFDNDRKVGARLVVDESLFLSRLRTCVPLGGDDWVQRRRRQLEDSAFWSFLTLQFLNDADGAAEDAVGLLAVGQTEGAVLSARQAFGFAVDAMLLGRREHDAGVKWRPYKLELLASLPLSFEDYWSIETMRDYDPLQSAEWVHRVVSLCKKISMEVEI
ncbi:nucleotidyltransferase domain-containing protein [Nocardia sp. NPDC049220]|uniref:nucleotidyltransferase domain-containing protein n=1 Tax=Nocardia sp. NPDC049220 TaxID=3155273 RepID=UPI0033C4AB00